MHDCPGSDVLVCLSPTTFSLMLPYLRGWWVSATQRWSHYWSNAYFLWRCSQQKSLTSFSQRQWAQCSCTQTTTKHELFKCEWVHGSVLPRRVGRRRSELSIPRRRFELSPSLACLPARQLKHTVTRRRSDSSYIHKAWQWFLRPEEVVTSANGP